MVQSTKQAQKMSEDIKEQVMKDQSDVAKMEPQEVIEKYINDDQTKLNAVYWATNFEERFRGNWFTIEQVQKKTNFKKFSDALGVLQVMCLVGVCHSSPTDKGTKYKITLNMDQKIMLMKKEKENLEIDKVNALQNMTFQYDMRIAALEDSIKKMSAVQDVPVELPDEVVENMVKEQEDSAAV